MHLCLRALICVHQGQAREAHARLGDAAIRFRALRMLPFALIAERAQAGLATDAGGARAVQRADRALAELGVARPDRFANLLFPSFGAEASPHER
jgi:hypothetical protein